VKIAILGGGNVYALNFARHLSEIGIEHFGIGRSGPKPKPLWQVDHHYRFWALHLVDQLSAYLALLDTEKPDTVVNFAAQGEGAASFGSDAHHYYTTNTVALVNLVEAIRQRPYINRFVQIGSSEVYGSVTKPSDENARLQPSSPYAISKAAFDQHLEIMHRVHGFPANVIRPSNAYCPGQQLHRIIPKAILCALGGQKLQLHGGGKSEKSYLHADDLSRAIVTVLERGTKGRIYNCGPDEPTAIRTVAVLVAAACNVKFEDLVQEAPERQGQDGRYWLDSSALKALGWQQIVELEHGINGMVEWVKAHPELLKADTTFRLRP
jgi:dTDP-glucose 4,6-dehydratase